MLLKKALEDFQSSFMEYFNKYFKDDLSPQNLYFASKHLITSGGKRLRPFLTYQCCKIVGGNVLTIMPPAISVELIHNFTLIHDDIMDNDSLRRGVPTVHVLWGVPMAILAGDLLFSKAFEIFFDCVNMSSINNERVILAAKKLASAVSIIAEGQALDISFEGRLFDESITESDYLNMIRKKTATLIRTACEIGGLIGMGNLEQVNSLANYGENIGMAFQMHDDILGILGDEKTLGKPVGSDIREGKCTLVLLHAVKNCDENQKKILLKYYGKKDLRPEELGIIQDLLRDFGSIKYVSNLAEKYVSRAKNSLELFPDSDDKKILIELADYVISRGY
ncbi:MAG: polyprenyl synthetase family protein [Candidatus Methanomethylicia archaeon]|nr:polyprenyl synthetase family protein [Candidatus Methanomethylicia archaeon]MCX8169072.1 polyprenyl synthetase family protein [Candidatus Methanomethylicia archaeon]MDW7988804.1 polyprenyl synthetase family protein [Nitrososphaerota archaeon]